MTGRRLWWLAALIGGARCWRWPVAAATTTRPGASTTAAATTGGECDTPDEVTLQLKWVTQAQFAGYYAAQEQGYYEDECLDVTIRPGGPDIVPEQAVLGGQAEFGIDWLDNLLATRDQGEEIVNIAQVFARSGMTEVALKDTGIDSIDDLRGKKVGVWLGGNEHKLFAALTKNGIDPQKDAEIVAQPFDMNLLLNREVDAAAAMTYNELAQVLEQKNPDTGELYTLDELNVIKMSDVGTGALEDGIFVTDGLARRRGEPGHRDAVPEGELPGLGVLPRQLRRVPAERARQRPDARRGPSALAAERDQRADLAERGRDRRHEPGRLRPDGADRQGLRDHQERRLARRLRLDVRRRPRSRSSRPTASTSRATATRSRRSR